MSNIIIDIAFTYATGGHLSSLPPDASSTQWPATDPMNPALTDDDRHAMYDTNITPTRLNELFDKLDELSGKTSKITNLLPDEPVLHHPKPRQARPGWLLNFDERDWLPTPTSPLTPDWREVPNAAPHFNCALAGYEGELDYAESQRMMGEITHLPTAYATWPPVMKFDPFADWEEDDAWSSSSSEGHSSPASSTEDLLSLITPAGSNASITAPKKSGCDRSSSFVSSSSDVNAPTSFAQSQPPSPDALSDMTHELAAEAVMKTRGEVWRKRTPPPPPPEREVIKSRIPPLPVRGPRDLLRLLVCGV
ncbi:hypothetical protein GLOTRDRAFT_95125 [Gloeophyllum trabeum ATCC 11539]|uniref:Uncharacterized protein n=1 Tax=Gloeophyllum trabeum (strain ATCC 11539 / FP-39264 / Madison 617) TaxID=670483 RepID=S7Q0R8_GLOTA|nr:uncharacterized protein GLOTRDRAFT_95125 [Gloeophyllum trabeum ATCC 11539]EPQ53092.1 hypothetical protein GLOTRDRAFT_95125 [Gloeophyllum trabeum ATCC 11539]